MQDIIKAQGGNPNINPDKIKVGKFNFTIKARKNGRVKDINNRNTSKIARLAGAPHDKGAGIYLYKHEGEKVKKGEAIFTIYSPNKAELDYAVESLKSFPIIRI